MVIFYKKRKVYNEFQLTKNKMDLNNWKMTIHPPSPEILQSAHINGKVWYVHHHRLAYSVSSNAYNSNSLSFN